MYSFPNLNLICISCFRNRDNVFYCTSQILRFCKLRAYHNPASSKSMGAIFQTVFPHSNSLSHLLVILIICQTFSTIIIVSLVICNINVTVMTCWSLLCWLVLFFLNHCIVFRLRSVHCFLRPSAIAHLIGQCHVNINSACSGKSERSYDSLYCRVHFILVFWNCTHPEGWLYLFPFWKTGDCLFWKL